VNVPWNVNCADENSVKLDAKTRLAGEICLSRTRFCAVALMKAKMLARNLNAPE
jgi:hypothetical protein